MQLRAAIVSIVALVFVPPASAQVAGNPNAGAVAGPVAAFQDGARIAYVDLDRIVALSGEGRSIAARLQDLRSRKSAEVEARGKQVESLQARLASDVLSEAARTQLQREFDRAQVDFQRFSQDAQADVQDAQRQMQIQFGEKLFPVIGQIAKEKDLWAVFNASPLLIWHDPRLDISEEVAKRLDTAPGAARP
jgi:Skp family chaperone for outer membrane proteins